MKLVRAVHIERFRSLADVHLDDLSDLVVLVGPNNSGKSNILRALNLFFNDETDPGSWVDFERDYYLAAPGGKKKYISVAVEFEIPANFPKFLRAGLEDVGEYLGARFWIRKTWTLKTFSEPELDIKRGALAWDPVAVVDKDKVRQFLDLVSFRYIPNRAVPADVIRDEWRAIRRELARRVKRSVGTSADEEVRETLRRIAGGMVLPIASDMKRSCSGLGDIELATPQGLAEMLEPSVFRAPVGGSATAKVEDTSLGAGVQALLMFHVLHTLVDKQSFRGGFGWKQAAVWAVEEPESSLHRELQLHLAALLRSYAVGDDKRFQVITTTHSEVFVYSATSAFAVTQAGPDTRAARASVAELALKAANQAVTGWTHPALKFPLDTLVLVEGDTDRRILTRAAQLLGKGTDLIFSTPSGLDEAVGGDGIKQVQQFIKRNNARLATRLLPHPLLVVVDWDQGSLVGEIVKSYGTDGSRLVTMMDEKFADPLVGQTFRGIERFFSCRLLELANDKGLLKIAHRDDGVLIVEREELERGKSGLADLFCREATTADCSHLDHILAWAGAVAQGMMC